MVAFTNLMDVNKDIYKAFCYKKLFDAYIVFWSTMFGLIFFYFYLLGSLPRYLQHVQNKMQAVSFSSGVLRLCMICLTCHSGHLDLKHELFEPDDLIYYFISSYYSNCNAIWVYENLCHFTFLQGTCSSVAWFTYMLQHIHLHESKISIYLANMVIKLIGKGHPMLKLQNLVFGKF